MEVEYRMERNMESFRLDKQSIGAKFIGEYRMERNMESFRLDKQSIGAKFIGIQPPSKVTPQ
jgi:hypothetical protein